MKDTIIFESEFDLKNFGKKEGFSTILAQDFNPENGWDGCALYVPNSNDKMVGKKLQIKMVKKYGRIMQILNPITHYSDGI